MSSETGRGRSRSILDVAASVAMICAASGILWSVFTKPQASTGGDAIVPREPVAIDDAPMMGDPNAKVAIVVFSDFECPYCGQFGRGTLPTLKTKYVDAGLVSIAFKHLPLSIHANAQRAAEASACADRQGRFWDFHDTLFALGPILTGVDFAATGATLGLEPSAFGRCLAGETTAVVEADVALARTLQISSTPSSLLGLREGDGRVRVQQVIRGAQPLEAFTSEVDRLLAS